MDTDVSDIRQRADAPRHRAESYLSVHERLAISALVTAVSLWIRVVEIIPDNRRRG
jgi:hypothetical protein